jgi:hypothetical protein
MQIDDVAGAGFLMQSIHILGNQRIYFPALLERG